jgi:hypothetical protein
MQNDFSNRSVNVGGSVHGGIIAGDGNIQNNPTEQTIAVEKVVEEILNQLSKEYPKAPDYEKQIAFKIKLQDKVKENPTLRDRLLNAAKAGGFELAKVLTDNPFISVPLETVKGWIEAEAH